MADLFQSIPAMIMLTGLLVALSGAVLGLFLVLRGSAMLTDAVSHSVVLAIVLVWLVTGATSGPWQVAGAVAMGLATVGLVALVGRARLVAQDAAIGLVFPALFAAGVLLINLYARDVHIDLDSVLLGEIGLVWLHRTEVFGLDMPVSVAVLGAMAMVNIGFVALFWKHLILGSFDPGLARALGLRPAVVGLGLMALTSATAVAAFEAVGAILFIAFVTAPAATGLLLTSRPFAALLTGCAVGAVSVLGGYALAVRADLTIAPVMALVAGVIFALALVLAPAQGMLARRRTRSEAAARTDLRSLLVHLASHGTTPSPIEHSRKALRDHLMWPEDRAARTILRGLDRGYLDRHGETLTLTDKGRAAALALEE